VREDDITETVHALRHTAVDMAAALAARDVGRAGAALDAYWAQKKLMAPLAEPAEVTAMIAVLRPLLAGASLCGAGGGGFLVGLTKEPRLAATGALDTALRADPRTRALKFSVHGCTVDLKGLSVTFA
jgi:fucokinase